MESFPGKLTDEYTHTFPTVISVSSHEKKLYWTIYVKLMQYNKFIPIKQEWYKPGTIMPDNIVGWYKVDSRIGDGIIKSSKDTIVKSGKNIGKKNETNVLQQALKDAQSKYKLQMKKSTPPSSSTSSSTSDSIGGGALIPPMLAKIYSKHPPSFQAGPVFVQRKYDGIRSLSIFVKDEVIIYSRQRNIYESPYIEPIKEALKAVFKLQPQLYIDGEIFNKDLPLQVISGMVRTTELNSKYNGNKLYYKIYDVFSNLEDKFSMRLLMLDYIKTVIPQSDSVIHIVDTYPVSSDLEVQKLYKEFREQKYEGAIVRLDAPYVPSYNSYHCENLLKIKPLFDAEFTLVGYELGIKGKAAGAIIMICETDEGNQFNVNPAMGIEERIKLGKFFKQSFAKYEGRKLIVEYEDISKKGIPLRARTNMLIRTDDDIIEKIEAK